ncbi:MAG: YihY/virulence factor BrkB family protein [Alphaproteobacteria bacterium]|nr:YihY/virulence factor BrkB family protein [Alphaproteobacteria bacterium]
MTIQPVRWPATSAWTGLLIRTWKEASEDNVGFLAAGVAFYAFLAFVPLLASVVLVYGLVADPPTVARHIGTLFASLPRDAAALIADQLKSLTASPKSSKGLSLALALALALYGASKGASGIVTALNIAFEVKETRSFVRTLLLSLAMTLGGLLVMLLAAAAISITAAVEAFLPGVPGVVHVLVRLVTWLVALAVVGTALALAYRYAPNRPGAPWRWITPGSAAASLLWLIASLGFGLYVSHFGNYNATYGSLGGVIVFLTWLYLSAYILLMGGELNSELEKDQEADARTQPRQPAAGPAPTVPPERAAKVRNRPKRSFPGRAAALGLLAGGGFLLLRRRRGARREAYLDRPIAPAGPES